ncbi:MAG: hypothetical protein F6K19_46680 [Cyanothece sp. SIO1E1]|nr:hypothetical protein [Cyanothece sp. SIO1E1]
MFNAKEEVSTPFRLNQRDTKELSDRLVKLIGDWEPSSTDCDRIIELVSSEEFKERKAARKGKKEIAMEFISEITKRVRDGDLL